MQYIMSGRFLLLPLAFPPEKRYIFPNFQHHFAPMETINRPHRRSIRLKEYDLPHEIVENNINRIY